MSFDDVGLDFFEIALSVGSGSSLSRRLERRPHHQLYRSVTVVRPGRSERGSGDIRRKR